MTRETPAMTPEEPTADADRLRHSEVRNYQVAALAGLVFVFGILFGRGSDLGAVLTVVFGVAGVFLRWSAAPVFVVMLTTYFLLFPTGLPDLGRHDPFEIRRGFFRIEDVILAGAMLLYVAAQYRLLGVLGTAIPAEGRHPPLTAAARRPERAIPEQEIVPLFWAVGAAILLGQILWLVLVVLRVDSSQALPLVAVDPALYRQEGGAGRFSPAGSRFVLLVGLVFFMALIAQVGFGAWRWRRLTRAEAGMMMQDLHWNELRREHMRLALWRVWATRRAEVRRVRKRRGKSS